MNSRGKIAIAIARQLESAPWLRSGLAAVYHRLRYVVHRDRGPRARLDPSVRLASLVDRLPAEYRDRPHFFGYYDKTPWGPDDASLLVHAQHSATEVALCVLQPDGPRVLGRTDTWNVQQGAMLQWLPGSDDIVWNTRLGDTLGALIVSPTGERRGELPLPVQAVCPTGTRAISLNYARILRTRPEYGYRGRFANLSPDLPLDRDGLWDLDLRTGATRLLVTLDTLRRTSPRPEMDGAEHYVNHVMYSPDGHRFVFLHRWTGRSGMYSRLYVCDADGTNLRLLRDERMASHFTWPDERTLLVWARTPGPQVRECYQLIDVETGEWSVLQPEALNALGDGHPTYSPAGRYLLTDTYPNAARRRTLVIQRPGEDAPYVVGDFFAPWKFDKAVRCDLHPRWNRAGTHVAIDSAHEGVRRMYVLDVRALVT